LQWRASFPGRVRSPTTAGSRQPLLLHGAGRLKSNDIRGTQTHVFKSGGRQPAVGRQMRIGRQKRRSSADRRRCGCVCVDGRCNCVYRRHGGLTPPALGTRTTTVHRKNDDFGDAQTHVRKSGGRQPAVGVSNAVAIANAFVQRRARQPAVD
jgi:hypothetical protein